MKKPSALLILTVLCLAIPSVANGQNLPSSMAFPDCATCSNLQFLDVTFPTLDESALEEKFAENTRQNTAERTTIAHSSASVLGAFGLIFLARRKR